MKFKKFLALAISLVLISLLISFGTRATPEPQKRKIIVFKENVSEFEKENLIFQYGGEKIKDLKIVKAKVVLLSEEKAKKMAKNPLVLRIEDDVKVYALENQVLPWGVDRVEAEEVWHISTGDPIKVAILDTGIDLTHPDLKDNVKGGYNAIRPTRPPRDDNGHGTHVAGIVAAVDNLIGVVGVGPKIDLYAVKVLNAAGTGYLSDVIEGIEWAIQNGMEIINMSLGTESNVQSFYEAIKKAYQAGITLVAAAGNTGAKVLYPAAYEEVIAVSAIDENNNLASFSSRGPEIDLAAPGVNIYSTYKKGTYKTLSGTSMAAPHVTGVAALVLDTKKCDFDNNGKCTPQEVKQRLEQTAQDLGNEGWDELFGAGLVNASKALTK